MYTPWWQRLSKPTLEERFELRKFKSGGPVKRYGFKYGGSWADWKTNYEDQMTFEEYLQDDTIVKKPHFLDRKADGGRIGFYKAGFVEGNPVGQQWKVKFASKSTSPGYPDEFIGTQYYSSEEAANAAIEKRKLISKKNIDIRDQKNVEMGKAKKADYKKIIDSFIEKGDYENFKTQVYESQMAKETRPGKFRKTKGGRVPLHILNFIRDRLDAGPGTELFEELKEITGRTDTELLEFKSKIPEKGYISIKDRSKTAIESWPEDRKLTDEQKLEGEKKIKETRKTKEKVGIKYASEQELQNFNKVNNQKKSLNKYFINNPDAINNTEFGKKIKALMEVRLNNDGEIVRRTVDSKGNPLNDEYYYNKAKKGHIFDIFDINKIEKGQRITKQAINLNIMPGQFNSGFIEGQVNRWFKPGGKFHGNTEKLNKISKYLDEIGVIVDIEGVGRIGGGEKVFYDSKTKKFPHITNTLKKMGAPDELITEINPPTKFEKFLKSTPVKLAKGVVKAGARTVGAAMPVIGPGMVAWGLSDVQKAHAAGLTDPDELTVAYNFGPQVAEMWSNYKAKEKKATLAGEKGLPEIDAFAAKDGGLSGVDQYLINRYK